MADVNDILNSMLQDMKSYEEEYSKTQVEISNVAKMYSDKIDELQKQRIALRDEGNEKIDVLKARAEQLCGMHKSLYDQYKKFTGKDPYEDEKKPEIAPAENKQSVNETPVTEKVDEPKEIQENKVETKPKKVAKKQEKPTESNEVLSPEEKAKLLAISKEASTVPVKDENGNEIPDYLQSSYAK